VTPPSDDLDELPLDAAEEAVLAALAEPGATPPPPAVRDRVLHLVARSPRPTVALLAPSQLYAARVAALAQLLGELEPQDWTRRAAPYAWSVHELVAHLLVMERYTGSFLGVHERPAGHDNDHLALGADVIAAEAGTAPADTVARWSAAAASVVDHVTSDQFEPDAGAPLHGWPFTGSSALVARAFELWTHAEDIRRATGRPLVTAPAPELRTMSSFSVTTLPFLLPMVAPEREMRPTRVVLTGAGGGTFDIGGDGDREALLATDVTDYCRVVARRIEPHDLRATIEGERELVEALLDASRLFAV
jgi:uncharacterized protein (TIGR03083 family)